MAQQLTSIQDVMDELYIHPMLQDIPLETAVRYAVNFMRIMGVPDMFEEKTEIITIHCHKGELPCDFYQVIQVRDHHRGRDHNECVYRHTTDTFHMSKHNHECPSDPTYKIQGGIIITSNQEGCIEMSYMAIATDECGFPMIPENASYIRALKAFIKKEWFTIKFDLGKIKGDILSNAQQEYAWAAGDCQSEFNRMTLDKAESFYNTWSSLVVRANEHHKHFKMTGSKEMFRIQP